MKNILLTLLTLLISSTGLYAQDAILTLDDVVRGGEHYASINKSALHNLQWQDDKHYSYIANDTILVIKNLSGKTSQSISTQDIKTHYQHQLKHFPAYRWVDPETLSLKKQGASFFYNINSKESQDIKYPEDAQNIDIAYPKALLAYTVDNNLFLATPDTFGITVYQNDDQNIVSGQTVHRNEFGINKGTFWSPDGEKLAYYIKDETKVHSYPLVDITARAGEAHFIKYPMAGMASEEVKLAIYDTNSRKSITLQTTGPADHYLTNVAWAPDHSCIYLAEINRGQDTMQLNSYDSKTGAFIQTLFTETSQTYVEPQTPLLFIPEQEKLFLWQSRRDGYNHLYLYNTQGELIKQVSQGDFEITSILGFDKKNQHVIVSSTEPSPLDRHIYALGLYDDTKVKYTTTPGYHQAQLSPKGKCLLDRWSSIDTPECIDLISLKNPKIQSLSRGIDPYLNFDMGTTQLIELKAADDSTLLYGRLILPPHFDASKKYPTIIYVYGGPHSQLINNSWYGHVQMWQHYMAQKGYVMFTLDNRGTSYRGADFEQVIHRQLGKNEMADQMKGYDYLCQQDYVDTARIGIFGWSFGGFMTTSLMTHYPNAFKVGVAGGPVIDWSNYEVMYGERYMDTPQENPEGYELTNLCHHAHKLKGRLLMIHGGQDPVVMWQHSQKFVRQCVIDGIQLDYFVYPTHEHNVRGKDRVHLMQKISQHFDDHL